MKTMPFKHDLGQVASDKVSGLTGILINRSQCLYGCNRYLIQPRVNADGKVPDSWWVDEDSIDILGDGVNASPKFTGGPMSRKC